MVVTIVTNRRARNQSLALQPCPLDYPAREPGRVLAEGVTVRSRRSGFSMVDSFGLIGDTHGNLGFTVAMLDAFRERDVELVVILGDFGFLWLPERYGTEELDRLNAHLEGNGQSLLFVDGNHEDHRALTKYPVADDGVRWLASCVGHLPRGYRSTLKDGSVIAALGGANSIDFEQRVINESWWTEEGITDDDLVALGIARVDVLLAHDAPKSVPSLDDLLYVNTGRWSSFGVFYAEMGRRKFHRGFMQVKPAIQFSGHYHFAVDEVVEYTDGDERFSTRVIVLDCDYAFRKVGAIFRAVDRHVTFLDADGKDSR
jgi:Calcineurin-like phosphoesterase superfamily domain